MEKVGEAAIAMIVSMNINFPVGAFIYTEHANHTPE